VKTQAAGYVSNRVLKLNVGFLLTAGSGVHHDTEFDVPRLRVSDDLDLSYVRGPLRLTRSKEGVLVQGKLHVGVNGECARCVDDLERHLEIVIEELYAYPPRPDSEFNLVDDGILDLAPLLREEALIALTVVELCRPDCKGLCPTCGTNWNDATCSCDDEVIDPRMAKLKELLDKK
jgi:uncharacterized protein